MRTTWGRHERRSTPRMTAPTTATPTTSKTQQTDMPTTTTATAAPATPAGAPATGTEPVLSQLSETTHADVARLIGASLQADPVSADPRPSQRASDTAVAAVSAHLAVMEATVYPEMQRYLHERRARARLRALRRSAREVESIARGIEQLVYGDQHRPPEPLPALRARLSELMAAHAEEEDALVAELEERMPAAERHRLVRAVEQGMRHAPTRPHPHLLFRTHLGARLVVRLAGRWDHILDTMDARMVAGTPVAPPCPPSLWGWYLLGRPVFPEPATAAASQGATAATSHDATGRAESATTNPPTSR